MKERIANTVNSRGESIQYDKSKDESDRTLQSKHTPVQHRIRVDEFQSRPPVISNHKHVIGEGVIGDSCVMRSTAIIAKPLRLRRAMATLRRGLSQSKNPGKIGLGAVEVVDCADILTFL